MIEYETRYIDGIVCDGYTAEPPQVPIKVAVYRCDVCRLKFDPSDLFDIGGDMVCEDCAKECGITYRELLEDAYGTVS